MHSILFAAFRENIFRAGFDEILGRIYHLVFDHAETILGHMGQAAADDLDTEIRLEAEQIVRGSTGQPREIPKNR
jgi:hypothetical protein